MNQYFSLFLSFLFILYIQIISSHRAPEKSPDLPDGWCDTRYGTPTRSTGECICKQKCIGKGCRHEQGIIWYEYRTCPKCQCILDTNIKQKSSVKEEPVHEKIESIPQSDVLKEDTEIEENELTISEYLEENSKYIFAGVVTLIVFGFAIIVLLGVGK
jgi:hypothetical protein